MMTIGATAPFRPAKVMELDVADPLPRLERQDSTGRSYSRAQFVVRMATEPLGLLDVGVSSEGISPQELARLLWERFGSDISVRFRQAGVSEPVGLGEHGLPLSPSWPFLVDRRRILTDAPAISVVVCTRDRSRELARCLGSLRNLAYPHFEILVVDNAPSTTDTAQLVEAQAGQDTRIGYVVEPRPGLSWARNRGWQTAVGDIVAYLDDDETADPHWLSELARGFRSDSSVGCVGGLVLPAELETQAQDWFEQFGGHSKGRGFRAASFGPGAGTGQSFLYPLPPFAVGANMAFTRRTLDAIGGFDPALGAGTRTHAGEDTAAFTDLLLGGYTLRYQPTALLWHHHRADLTSLRAQLYGYGVGLTAFYTRLLLSRPGLAGPLLRLLPRGARDVLGRKTIRTATMRDFPRQLNWAQRRGMFAGPLAYLGARRHCREVARAHVRTAGVEARR